MVSLALLIENLVINSEGIHLEHNYMNEDVDSPLLEKLSLTSTEHSSLVKQLTGNGSERENLDFRKRVREKLITLLPCWNKLKNENKIQKYNFLERRLNSHDLNNYDFTQSSLTITRGFMAFYAGGLRCGGLITDAKKRIIISDIKEAYYLGSLSLVPYENEVLIPEGVKLECTGRYVGKDVLSNVSDEIREYIKHELDFCEDYEYFLMKQI